MINRMFKIISSSIFLSMLFSVSILTLGEIISWILGFADLNKLSLVSAPIVGALIGLAVYEINKVRHKQLK